MEARAAVVVSRDAGAKAGRHPASWRSPAPTAGTTRGARLIVVRSPRAIELRAAAGGKHRSRGQVERPAYSPAGLTRCRRGPDCGGLAGCNFDRRVSERRSRQSRWRSLTPVRRLGGEDADLCLEGSHCAVGAIVSARVGDADAAKYQAVMDAFVDQGLTSAPDAAQRKSGWTACNQRRSRNGFDEVVRETVRSTRMVPAKATCSLRRASTRLGCMTELCLVNRRRKIKRAQGPIPGSCYVLLRS